MKRSFEVLPVEFGYKLVMVQDGVEVGTCTATDSDGDDSDFNYLTDLGIDFVGVDQCALNQSSVYRFVGFRFSSSNVFIPLAFARSRVVRHTFYNPMNILLREWVDVVRKSKVRGQL